MRRTGRGRLIATAMIGLLVAPGAASAVEVETASVGGQVRWIPPGATTPTGLADITVYADLNNNETLDDGEPFDVSVDATFLPTATYLIEGIPAGDVTIRIVNPDPSVVAVTQPPGGAHQLTLAPGETATDRDFLLELIPDTTPPVPPSPPEDVNLQCAADLPSEAELWSLELTAVDDYDGPITVAPTIVVSAGPLPNDVEIVRTWTFADSSGNSSAVSQTLLALDTLAPVPPPAPANTVVVGVENIPSAPPLTAIDNCDGPVDGTLTEEQLNVVSEYEFVLSRTWTFADARDNASSVAQMITVEASPEQHFELLGTTIDDLVADGELKSGQAKGLLRPLDKAMASYEAGRLRPACSQLSDFIDEVEQKRLDGALRDDAAAALTARAEDLFGDIGCT